MARGPGFDPAVRERRGRVHVLPEVALRQLLPLLLGRHLFQRPALDRTAACTANRPHGRLGSGPFPLCTSLSAARPGTPRPTREAVTSDGWRSTGRCPRPSARTRPPPWLAPPLIPAPAIQQKTRAGCGPARRFPATRRARPAPPPGSRSRPYPRARRESRTGHRPFASTARGYSGTGQSGRPRPGRRHRPRWRSSRGVRRRQRKRQRAGSGGVERGARSTYNTPALASGRMPSRACIGRACRRSRVAQTSRKVLRGVTPGSRSRRGRGRRSAGSPARRTGR